MGRKIDMKKIEDVTKCQVTFSKRRSSLMKKANEIAICCDVDVAFVAFSPSGRISKFCNKKRIEDVLHRYVDLPAESRLRELDDVQMDSRVLQNQDHEISFSSNLMENELNSGISPLLSAKVQVQGIVNSDLDTPNTSNLPISFQNSQQATFSNAFYNSIPNLSNMPPPRSSPSTIFTGYGSTQYATCNFTNKDDTIQTSSQYAACNFTDKGEEETSQSNILNASKQEFVVIVGYLGRQHLLDIQDSEEQLMGVGRLAS
ncbi:floral homeotic protein GLOBOSA-like [Salvia splendens]|uniref:floral homeotic protein GLOBOSA-like n=1 Tax=Salvia splendens TaxID=180675 RepID=UPI001C27E832|nr:floral homeotic protein GLOBOSA-like [Salvia splendens]